MAASRSGVLLVLLTLPAGLRAFDLDACSSKPTYNDIKCIAKANSAVACWSHDPLVPWRCWNADWAPAWALSAGPGGADAMCMTEALEGVMTPPNGKRPTYDGACTFENPTEGQPLKLPTGMSWEKAHRLAKPTVRKMNSTEKRMLTTGVGWGMFSGYATLQKYWYDGNTAAIPRLGLPSLNMQDSADGFSTRWDMVGTVTSWPSLLAIASTWDPSLVQNFAAAVGTEFRNKGANVILGPGVNVIRVAVGGRNFEYISGEDPFLGSKLIEAYVKGVQSAGIIAAVKSWPFGEQETNRSTLSLAVDEATAFEIYYPPFQAAIEAGVDGIICSPGKIHHKHVCASKESLNTLKNQMNFQGFVQADLWAADRTSTYAGSSQPAHGDGAFFETTGMDDGPNWDDDVDWDDDVVARIVSAIYRSGVDKTTPCSPPNCKDWLLKNVTSASHAMLSRTLAAESIVMLRNEKFVLPLQPPKVTGPATGLNDPSFTIAVVGSASVKEGAQSAQGDPYSAGGSGHIASGYYVTPLQGIQERAKLAGGAAVLSSPTDDIDAALDVAKQADVVIVVGAVESTNRADRANLTLDNGVDALITAVAEVNPKTVVLLEVPGAVLTPWREQVAAILTLFYGGQETGHAWASVLFGDHAPTGRLPIMFPDTEDDTIQVALDKSVVYSEGMSTSYRNKAFSVAYPFGHGLTYTDFAYEKPRQVKCHSPSHQVCISIPITNTGSLPGRTVVQLYLELDRASGHPAPFLKGFKKTPVLLPGQRTHVNFGLAAHQLSFYSKALGAFVETSTATAHFGESSADLRHSLVLQDLPWRWRHGWLGWRFLGVLSGGLILFVGVNFLRFCKKKGPNARDGGLLGEGYDDDGSSSGDSKE